MHDPLDPIRAQLDPIIRARGLRTVSRAANVPHTNIVRWLRTGIGMSIAAIASVAEACGLRLAVRLEVPATVDAVIL